MEIKILKSDFLNGLNATQGVVEKKNVMPILANVLIEARDQNLVITATDLEVAVTIDVPAQVKTPGKLTVQARSLYEIIKESASDEIQIRGLDGDRLELSAGMSQYKFLMMPAKEFPKLPEIDSPFTEIPTALFTAMLGKVSFAMSTDETRYHLNGILLEKKSGGILAMVATDGHRLAYQQGEMDLPMKQDKVILPRKGVNELLKFVDGIDKFKLGVGDRHLFIKVPGKTLFIRLVDGDFPEYTRVIPTENPLSIQMPRQELAGALRRVSLLASDRSKGVSFYFCNGSLSVSSSNPEIGEAKEELTIPYKGPVINIGFNARYFLDVLGVIPDDMVRIVLKDEISPCLVLSDLEKDFKAVVMPMRM